MTMNKYTNNIATNQCNTTTQYIPTTTNPEYQSSRQLYPIPNNIKSGYRKSYIAWDKTERANKPDNYTDKTRYLGKNSRALLAVIHQKLKKKSRVFLNHKYISTITSSGRRQNQNIINELKGLLDIKYHNSFTDKEAGKKYRYSYEFSFKQTEELSTKNSAAQEESHDTIKPVDNARSGTLQIKEESLEKTCKKSSGFYYSVGKKISRQNPASTIYKENKIINNRSGSNFIKNSFDSFSNKKNSNPETKNKSGRNTNLEQNTEKTTKEKSRELSIPNTNGFLGSGKYLNEMLEYLTDEMCSLLRSNCGRDFTNRAIREIVKAVSRSRKGSRAFFYHIKGFIAYLSRILRFEKRDAEAISSNTYYIAANQTEEEREVQKQEKYLSKIENSLQVSPECHLKKKLANTLSRSKAYNILTSYKGLKIEQGGTCKLFLDKHVELSELDKEIILSQIRASHERIGDDGNYTEIGAIDLIMPEAQLNIENLQNIPPFSSDNNSKPNTQAICEKTAIWVRIRARIAKSFGSDGDAIDTGFVA